MALAWIAFASAGVASARGQDATAFEKLRGDIEVVWSKYSALRTAAPDGESALAFARDVAPLVAALWSAPDGGSTGLSPVEDARLLELARFRIEQIGPTDARRAADEFTQVWMHVEKAPPWPLDSAANLTAWLDLRMRWLAALDSFVENLDPEARAKLAALIRATPVAAEAARAFEAEAARVDRELRAALLANGATAAPQDPSPRVKSIRLLEEERTLVGAVVTLDDGRELSVRDETEVGGVRLDDLVGASFEPAATLTIDGVPLRCYPRSGIVHAPWPTATRRVWLRAQFGPEGTGTFAYVHSGTLARLRTSPTYVVFPAGAVDAGTNPDLEVEFSAADLAKVADAVVAIAKERADREGRERGDLWDEFDFIDTSGVTDAFAPIAATWVGGKSAIVASAEFQERAWLSLAWIMGLPSADRAMALAWVRGEVAQEEPNYLLQLATDVNVALPRLPDFDALVGAVAGAEARLTYVAAGLDAGAPEEDRAALLMRLLPLVAELTGGPDRAQLPEEARPAAPQGVPMPLAGFLLGWLREDPNPGEPRHQRFAASLAPFVRVLETIGAGEPLDVVQAWRAEDSSARYKRMNLATDLFEMTAFRIGHLLATSDVEGGLREFEIAWAAVPKVLGPVLTATVERRDWARRVLLRPVLRHRLGLTAEQRRGIRALLDATDVWSETAEMCEAEARARCVAVRERIAAAAGTSTAAKAVENGTIRTMDAEIRDGAIVGVRLGLPDDVEITLEPGQEAHDVALLEMSDSWLDPIARLRCGDETFLAFPLTATCFADWPSSPRSAWLDARYGGPGTEARKHMELTRHHFLSVAPARFGPELWNRIEPPLRDLSVESDLTFEEIDVIVATGATGGVFVEFDGPEMVAWLAPRLVVAGEVDAEERFWQTFARVCRFEDASVRDEALGYLDGQWAAVRKPWMRVYPGPAPKVDYARQRALAVRDSAALLAD